MHRKMLQLELVCVQRQALVAVITALFFCFFMPCANITTSASVVVLIDRQEKTLSEFDNIVASLGKMTIEFPKLSNITLKQGTKIKFTKLPQKITDVASKTPAISDIYLEKGEIEITLYAAHQTPKSSCTITTPNAVIDVKFSKPHIRVQFDPGPDGGTTVAEAVTVALAVTNIKTATKRIIPVGSTAIINSEGIQVKSYIEDANPSAQSTPSPSPVPTVQTEPQNSLQFNPKLALEIAGGVAVVGLVTAVVLNSGGEEQIENVFTGTFRASAPDGAWTRTFELTQTGESITGRLTREERLVTTVLQEGGETSIEKFCMATATIDVSGTIEVEQPYTATLNWPPAMLSCLSDETKIDSIFTSESSLAILSEDKRKLAIERWATDFPRTSGN